MANPISDQPREGNFAAGLAGFLRDFAAFAGRKGIHAAILVAFGAVLEGFGLVLVVPLLGIVIGTSQATGRLEAAAAAAFQWFGIERPFGQLAFLLGVFCALMIVRAVVISTRDVTVTALHAGFIERQRLAIMDRLAAASWAQVASLRHARVTHLMSGDMQRAGAVAHFSLQCAISAVMLLAQCVLVFVLAPLLASLVFGLLVLAAAVLVPTVRRMHILGGTTTKAHLSLLNLTAQFLGGLKLAMSQNLQASFVAEFRQTLRELTELQVANMRSHTNRRLALTTLSAFAAVGLLLAGYGVFDMSPPVLIALLLVVARMVGPIGQIQHGAQQIAYALPAYAAVKELERDLARIRPERSAPSLARPLPDGPIVFHDVSFRHSAADDGDGGWMRGVEGISLAIAPGEFIGITGPSGAGKTTFADLLVGLFPPQEGRITVGGAALDGAALSAWRDAVSYISQDPFLFHDTIRRNLAWASPRASEADIWQALAIAGADRLVRHMAQGLDTVVGERGTLVSGGERQRIALARAVLRQPRLLVLDEATGAIDAAGEREILERLRALQPRPAIVMIAHRAESIALCDRVIRFDGGRCAGDEMEGVAPGRNAARP